MNAIENNASTQAWEALARELPRPRAVLCVSAHWESNGTRVAVTPKPRTIHDFSGFPEALNRKRYPAPGAPEWAERTRQLVRSVSVSPDTQWGLDHGTWVVMERLFPEADVPIFQLSLDRTASARSHYEIGAELAPLRDEGVLIVASGNMVHNLPLMEQRDRPFPWAAEADAKFAQLIEARDHDALVAYESLGKAANLAIPTNEHYLPLLYALALRGPDEPLRFFAEQLVYGSISMRSIRIG
jgi:4,5-DOPA dioxygenase extradiol